MNIDDLINQKLDHTACAEMAAAKGDEMTDKLNVRIAELEASNQKLKYYIEKLIVTGRPLAKWALLSSDTCGRVLPKLEAETWDKIVSAWIAEVSE